MEPISCSYGRPQPVDDVKPRVRLNKYHDDKKRPFAVFEFRYRTKGNTYSTHITESQWNHLLTDDVTVSRSNQGGYHPSSRELD